MNPLYPAASDAARDMSLDFSITSITSVEASIKSAYQRGLFSQYVKELDKRDPFSFSSTMYETLLAIINDKNQTDIYSEVRIESKRALYLFSICVDPDISVETKNDQIAQFLATLNKREQESFHYTLLHSLPPVMTCHILQRFDSKTWQIAFTLLFKHHICNPFERKLFSLLKTVVQNSWPIEDKQQFLDRLFTTMPQNRVEELVFYAFLQEGPSFIASLCQVSSIGLQERLTAFSSSICQKGEERLKKAGSQKYKFRLRCYNNQHLRRCIIKWFIQHKALDPAASYFVAGISEEDWEWLKDARILNKQQVLHWLGMASTQVCDDDDDSRYSISMLFKYITHWLDDQYLPIISNQERDTHIRQLATNITPVVLYNSIHSFQETFRKHLMSTIIAQEPQKIVDWCSLVASHADVDKAKQLFRYCSPYEDQVIARVFCGNDLSSTPLVLYTCLEQQMRTRILKAVTATQEVGLKILEGWFSNYLCNETASLPTFVRDSFSGDFYTILTNIDPALAPTLKERVQTHIQQDSEASEYLKLTFPIGVAIDDPAARQTLAIARLKRCLLNPESTPSEQRTFIGALRGDLFGNAPMAPLVRRLISELPQNLWPFLFLYFESAFCQNHYFSYYEEKSRGGTFKQVDKDAQPRMRAERKEMESPGTLAGREAIGNMNKQPKIFVFEKWPEWVEMAAVTLTNMADNPLFSLESHIVESMQHLFQAACETNTIHKIITRFMEICPSDRFVGLMNYFCNCAFFHNKEDFKSLIADCLMDERFNKQRVTMIAGWIVSSYNKPQSCHGNILQVTLWENRCTKDDVERADIMIQLFNTMKEQFLGLFINGNYIAAMIKCLHNVNPDQCTILFKQMLVILCSVENPIPEKISIFHDICNAYKKAQIDVGTLLSRETPELATIGSWYSLEILKEFLNRGFPPFPWWLLQDMKPELVYPAVVERTSFIFNDDRLQYYYFEDLLKALGELGLRDAIMQKLAAENGALVENMKMRMQQNIIEIIYFTSDFSYIEQYVPDWKERLSDCLKKIDADNRQRAFSDGQPRSVYEIEKVCRSLTKNGKLASWQSYLEEQSDAAFFTDINTLCQQLQNSHL